MIGIQYRKSIPRYLALKAIGPRWRGIYTSRFSPVALIELSRPKLPAPDWLWVRPILSGICGSDLATICATGSIYLSPLTSMPFVLGHEIVGTVIGIGPDAEGVSVGDRVVLQPALGCRVRGIEPLCDACASKQPALCRNVTRGAISAGVQTGFCRDTGGGWSECLVAHPSQVYKVPDSMEDEIAVLTEPFACALHGALRAGINGQCPPLACETAKEKRPHESIPTIAHSPMEDPHSAFCDGDLKTVLVMGCGSIGLLTIAALKMLYGPNGYAQQSPAAGNNRIRIIAVAKYPHQREHALRLGADEVILYTRPVKRRYQQLAEALGAELHQPEIGNPTVIGGADVTYDCVASSTSIDDCCRFTNSGGSMVLVGMPSIPRGIDWTSIWHKELTLHAAYAYGCETIGGCERSTFEWAIQMLEQKGFLALRSLIGSPHSLRDYRQAIYAALNTGESKSVKTVFQIEPEGKHA